MAHVKTSEVVVKLSQQPANPGSKEISLADGRKAYCVVTGENKGRSGVRTYGITSGDITNNTDFITLIRPLPPVCFGETGEPDYAGKAYLVDSAGSIVKVPHVLNASLNWTDIGVSTTTITFKHCQIIRLAVNGLADVRRALRFALNDGWCVIRGDVDSNSANNVLASRARMLIDRPSRIVFHDLDEIDISRLTEGKYDKATFPYLDPKAFAAICRSAFYPQVKNAPALFLPTASHGLKGVRARIVHYAATPHTAREWKQAFSGFSVEAEGFKLDPSMYDNAHVIFIQTARYRVNSSTDYKDLRRFVSGLEALSSRLEDLDEDGPDLVPFDVRANARKLWLKRYGTLVDAFGEMDLFFDPGDGTAFDLDDTMTGGAGRKSVDVARKSAGYSLRLDSQGRLRSFSNARKALEDLTPSDEIHASLLRIATNWRRHEPEVTATEMRAAFVTRLNEMADEYPEHAGRCLERVRSETDPNNGVVAWVFANVTVGRGEGFIPGEVVTLPKTANEVRQEMALDIRKLVLDGSATDRHLIAASMGLGKSTTTTNALALRPHDPSRKALYSVPEKGLAKERYEDAISKGVKAALYTGFHERCAKIQDGNTALADVISLGGSTRAACLACERIDCPARDLPRQIDEASVVYGAFNGILEQTIPGLLAHDAMPKRQSRAQVEQSYKRNFLADLDEEDRDDVLMDLAFETDEVDEPEDDQQPAGAYHLDLLIADEIPPSVVFEDGERLSGKELRAGVASLKAQPSPSVQEASKEMTKTMGYVAELMEESFANVANGFNLDRQTLLKFAYAAETVYEDSKPSEDEVKAAVSGTAPADLANKKKHHKLCRDLRGFAWALKDGCRFFATDAEDDFVIGWSRRRRIDPSWTSGGLLVLDGEIPEECAKTLFGHDLDIRQHRARDGHGVTRMLIEDGPGMTDCKPGGKQLQTVRRTDHLVAACQQSKGSLPWLEMGDSATVGIVAPKELCAALNRAKVAQDVSLPGLSTGTTAKAKALSYSRQLGRNELEAVDFLLLISRYLPPVSIIEGHAQALFGGGDIEHMDNYTFEPIETWTRHPVTGEVTKTARVSISHPDARCRAMIAWEVFGCLRQADARARPVNRGEDKAATILHVLGRDVACPGVVYDLDLQTLEDGSMEHLDVSFAWFEDAKHATATAKIRQAIVDGEPGMTMKQWAEIAGVSEQHVMDVRAENPALRAWMDAAKGRRLESAKLTPGRKLVDVMRWAIGAHAFASRGEVLKIVVDTMAEMGTPTTPGSALNAYKRMTRERREVAPALAA